MTPLYFGRDLLPILARKEAQARRRLIWERRRAAFMQALVLAGILTGMAYLIGGIA